MSERQVPSHVPIHVPTHVPAELVRDFDYLDSSSETDVYRYFAKLHDGPDIFYTERNHGHWVFTRYADMEYVLQHSEDFSSKAHTIPMEGKPDPVPLVEYDGKLHADFRLLLSPFFTPKAVGDLKTKAGNFTNALIDEFYGRGECDFTRDFALKMPIGIMMDLMGLPDSDRDYLLELSDNIVRADSAQMRAKAFADVYAYVGQKVLPLRRANPGSDLFSCLLQGKVDGGRALADKEIMGLGVLLIGAGLDTVVAMLGFITRFIADHPAHRQQLLDDPALINDALEEMMRRYHIANLARMVTRDIEYKSVQLKAGDLILLPTTLAGIDERRYVDPWTVNFQRNDKKILAFGTGPHQCIGAYLARTELRVFLAEWLKRIPHFAVKPGVQVVTVTGRANATPSLPLVWKTQ